MKRAPVTILIAAAILAAPVLRADVKMQQKNSLKFAGAVGAVINKFGGSTTNEGTVSNVAIKGNRKLEMSQSSGQIVDLDEQKVYGLDPKNKTYRVATFAELRAAFEKAKADAGKDEKGKEAKGKDGDSQAPDANGNPQPTRLPPTVNGILITSDPNALPPIPNKKDN